MLDKSVALALGCADGADTSLSADAESLRVPVFDPGLLGWAIGTFSGEPALTDDALLPTIAASWRLDLPGVVRVSAPGEPVETSPWLLPLSFEDAFCASWCSLPPAAGFAAFVAVLASC